ncbi:hypothetical protein DFR86_03115 [Acidianus sulfidivorans JP7]|uniref:Uncharacterized protein n=1 Tax=Acidianus sulfidivorans JP7 TaxID=619593 RepID=A0A2U9IKU5_9CREN|nr:hypothetical protein [Acidianus sulfidivorans]AWR96641.1 hypothetical protein DFR86_03115 [Acidianus sulfidivorans JP7]
MPTIHLSLPESMYEELRKKADEMGIQITDLVKFYIRQGIEEKDNKQESARNAEYEESIAFLEAKVAQLDAMVAELVKKLRDIEDMEEEEPVELKGEENT